MSALETVFLIVFGVIVVGYLLAILAVGIVVLGRWIERTFR
jgi:hypothetical protein